MQAPRIREELLLQQKLDELPALSQNDTTGLRLDFAPTRLSGEDVTVVKITSTGCIQKELKAVKSRQISKQVDADLKMPDVL